MLPFTKQDFDVVFIFRVYIQVFTKGFRGSPEAGRPLSPSPSIHIFHLSIFALCHVSICHGYMSVFYLYQPMNLITGISSPGRSCSIRVFLKKDLYILLYFFDRTISAIFNVLPQLKIDTIPVTIELGYHLPGNFPVVFLHA